MVKTPLFYQIVFFLLFLFIAFDSTFSYAVIYSWEDENGITNFTNDKSAIPKQFRDQSKLILKSKQKTKDFDNQKAVIPLRRSGSVLTVSAKINGFLPALFVVDTEATHTTISRVTAAKSKINIASTLPTLSLQTANGTTDEKSLSLTEKRISKSQINLDYFKNELKILNNKATLLMAPINWR